MPRSYTVRRKPTGPGKRLLRLCRIWAIWVLWWNRYAVKKPNISAEWTFHELFHLLILAGSFFHYLAVYLYVL